MAGSRLLLEIQCPIRRLAAHLDPDPGGQPVADGGDQRRKFGIIDADGRIAVVEDVPELFASVAIVDVHMHEPGAQAGHQALGIFSAVAHQEGAAVASHGAASQHRAGKAGRPRAKLAPAAPCLTVDERWLRRIQRGHRGIENGSETQLVRHDFISPLASLWTARGYESLHL